MTLCLLFCSLLEEDPSDSHTTVVVLSAIRRMEPVDIQTANLKIIARLLACKHTVVQTLAAQVLAFQLQRASSDLRDALITVLVQQLDAIYDGERTEATSSARGFILQLFADAHKENLIELSLEVTRTLTTCVYDKDVMVQAQALQLLQLLRSPLYFSMSGSHSNGSLPVADVTATTRNDKALEDSSERDVEYQYEKHPCYVMIEGQLTNVSKLLKETSLEHGDPETALLWIRALDEMQSFDEDSMRAVTEKLTCSPHWSVRKAAAAYLHRGLQLSPPPLPPSLAEESACSATAEVSRAPSHVATEPSCEESVLVGMQNEREIAREAIKHLQSDVAGVRNTAAQFLKTILPSNNGARDVILEGSALAKMLADHRTRQLCFTAFAGDSELLEKCQMTHMKDCITATLHASERRCAAQAGTPDLMSSALDKLLTCSKDPDVSVRVTALEQWGMHDFSECDEGQRQAAIAKLLKHACNSRHAGESSRETAVLALPAVVARGHPKVTRALLDLLEDDATRVRMAAAETLLELAPATEDVVSHLIRLVDRPEQFWRRRDHAMMEIKAAAFWILSKIEPQFSTIPGTARRDGNHSVVNFLWGNASAEKKLMLEHELDVWVKNTLAAGDSLLVKVRRAIGEGRWEDARHDANQAMEEYLIAKSKGSHPEIFHRILVMDKVLTDIANKEGRTWERPIDAKIRQIDESWVPSIHAVDRQGWTRLHYLTRWDMPQEIKKMVAAGLDINAVVLSGAYKGATPFDLAETDAMRSFISDLGGTPSRPTVPEYSIIPPEIPKPKTGIRRRTAYTDEELAKLMPDARRCCACTRFDHSMMACVKLPQHDKYMLERMEAYDTDGVQPNFAQGRVHPRRRATSELDAGNRKRKQGSGISACRYIASLAGATGASPHQFPRR